MKNNKAQWIIGAIALLVLPLILQSFGNAWVRIADLALLYVMLALGVVASSKNGKDVTYAATEAGRAHVQRYREIRESCLIDALNADDGLNRDIGELARLLRVLSGMYDQAARAAASM